MNTFHATAATGNTFCGVLEALLVGPKVFQTFLSIVSNCDIFYAVDECSLNLCKYFCKGTDAVKSKQLWNCDFFFSFSFFVLYTLLELILLAERVMNNISHVIFVEEKLFEGIFWFSLTCIHCKRLSCASSKLGQNFFVFVNWFKYMEFYTGFLLCYICIMCRYDIFFTTFSILIQCGILLYYSSILNTVSHSCSETAHFLIKLSFLLSVTCIHL